MSKVELPSPDAALLELDKLARDFNINDYGLPFYTEGGHNDELPLSDYYSEDLVLDKLRDVMRSYARAAVEAALEAAAKLCDERASDCADDHASDGDERWLVYAKHARHLAAAIRDMKT